jgi:hypothetical protein
LITFQKKNGRGAMPELSPLCSAKQTLARATYLSCSCKRNGAMAALRRRNTPFHQNRKRGLLPSCQMIVDVICDILADGCQLKHLVLDSGIVCLLGKSPIRVRLIAEIIRPIHGRTARSTPAGARADGQHRECGWRRSRGYARGRQGLRYRSGFQFRRRYIL